MPDTNADDEDILSCVPVNLSSNTACNFNPELYFDGSQSGYQAMI
jgi:hypothetical protein